MQDRWKPFGRVLAGLPYDVQAQLYSNLSRRRDIDPASLYRLPLVHTVPRVQIVAGGQAVAAWRIVTLSAIYGVSRSVDNETGGSVAGATLVYPSEINVQIDFNQGQTQWIGSAQEPCSLASFGDASHVTRVDPIVAKRQDVWDLTLTGDPALLNAVFCRVTLHGVKIYSAEGAI